MPVDPAADARALLALAALLLLPGLSVVPAPWTAVPFLSLAFWLVSWTWLPALGATREHFVWGALLFFGALTALRLGKPLTWTLPGRSSAGVALVALAQLAPLACLSLPPGDGGPLRALTVRLLAWRDGWPATYEPLAPVHVFGADVHGVDLLAGDLALLGHVPPALASLVAALAAQGLLLLALDALLTRLPRPAGRDAARAASACVVVALGALGSGLSGAPATGWLARVAQALPTSAQPATLSLALALSATAWLARGTERAPAVAAGLALGAALVADPPFAVMFLAPAVVLALARLARLSPAERRPEIQRLALAAGFGLGLALPRLWGFDLTLSAHERAAGASLEGAAYVYACGWIALAVLVAWKASQRAVERGLVPALVLALAAAAWAAPRLDVRTPPSAADVRNFEMTAARTSITDLVCIDPATAQAWIPALAGRGVEPALLPAFYADELRRGFEGRRCRPPGPGTPSMSSSQSLETE